MITGVRIADRCGGFNHGSFIRKSFGSACFPSTWSVLSVPLSFEAVGAVRLLA